MKISDAIYEARQQKCKIKNTKLPVPMYGQSAKDLVQWLLLEEVEYKKAKKILKLWMKSNEWELDFDNN